jgi:hypothetical protein
VRTLFGELWGNDDVARYRLGVAVLDGRHEWLEHGMMGLDAKKPTAAPPTEAKQEVPVGA